MKRPSKKPAPLALHPHTKRALTQIRSCGNQAYKAISIAQEKLDDARQWLDSLNDIAGENDARELKKRPSLKRKKARR